MSAASNYLENEILDHVLASGAYPAPLNVFLALFTDDQGTVGSENNTAERLEKGNITDEVDGGAYIRKNINVDGTSGAFNPASGGIASNVQTLTFNTASDNVWGTVTHVAVMDAETAGNVLFWGAVTTPKTIETGDTFQVTAGNLSITLN